MIWLRSVPGSLLCWAALCSTLLACARSGLPECGSQDPGCEGACTGALLNCNGDPADGCEIDTTRDVQNCGGCGRACSSVQNGRAGCVAGRCGVGACLGGFADCDGRAGNGCETDTRTDAASCGGCGARCPAVQGGTATCTAGRCGMTCAADRADCNGDPADGCEVELARDSENCGDCGLRCTPIGSVTRSCLAGACAATGCAAPYLSCDPQRPHGCETDGSDDVRNCGACGRLCALPHATPLCVGQACVVVACDKSFENCDQLSGNGCEADLKTSLDHCGACGHACRYDHATARCTDGGCDLEACLPGFRDCDGRSDTGCEIDTTTDANHCGACGNACGAAQVCVAGACQRCDFVGPQQNLSVAAVTRCGFSQCYLDNFSARFDVDKLVRACDKQNVIEACRRAGSATLQLAAMAPRDDVFFDTGNATNVTHTKNGTSWYYSRDFSMGFAPGGAAINRASCDLEPGELRMCIHTPEGDGYRCGEQRGLQGSNTTYERIFFHKD